MTTTTNHRGKCLLTLAISIVVVAVGSNFLSTSLSRQAFLPQQALGLHIDPLAWMSRAASFAAGVPKHLPKINAPLVQMDMGNSYYTAMIDSMLLNFKKTLYKYSDESGFSMLNASTHKPIQFVQSNLPKTKQVIVKELTFDGLNTFKISNVRVDKNDMKLYLNFVYRNIKMFGSVFVDDKKLNQTIDKLTGEHKPLLDAIYWNASWSSSLIGMIGKESFDMKKVFTKHSQQKVTFNLKELPVDVQQHLSKAFVERIEEVIRARITEAMTNLIMRADLSDSKTPNDLQEPESSDSILHQVARSIVFASSNKEKMTKHKSNGTKKRGLKRTKRQTPCQPGEELDDHVDDLFRFGQRLIRAMEPATAPNVTIELPDYNLKIFLYEGKVMRAYKFRRAKPAWVFCSNATISLGVTIETDQTRAAYKYRVISGHRLLFDGDLEAKLSPRLQAQFSQAVKDEDSEEPVQQRVDRLRLNRLGKVVVVIRGLGNLTQSLSLMINSYLNDNQQEMQPMFRMLEGDAVKMANKLLKNVNVPLLSVV